MSFHFGVKIGDYSSYCNPNQSLYPAVLFSDNFNRANSTLSTPWITTTGYSPCEVNNSRLSSAKSSTQRWSGIGNFPRNSSISFIISSFDTTANGTSIQFLSTPNRNSSSNYLSLVFDENGYRLYSYIGGQNTLLGQNSTIPHVNDQINIIIADNKVKIMINQTVLFNITIPSGITDKGSNNYVAFCLYNNMNAYGNSFDNLIIRG